MITSAQQLRAARDNGRAGLICYIPAGFPTVQKSVEIACQMVANGADVIELGHPYSDPGMDGPVISQAASASLAAGTRTDDVLWAVEKVAATGAAVLVMTYYNPVLRRGVENFARQLSQAGGCGLIIPDLPPEEGAAWEEAAEQYSLECIYLASPASPMERLKMISDHTRGWVYAASTMGITGAREKVDAAAPVLTANLRSVGAQLVSVGLGVSTRAQAAEIASYADGVIVGSALLRPLLSQDLTYSQACAQVFQLTQELRAGVEESS